MLTRGIYDRDGEMFAYTDGSYTYDLDGNRTGVIRGNVVYSLDDERLWLLDSDAICDPKGNVLGYLGEPRRHEDE